MFTEKIISYRSRSAFTLAEVLMGLLVVCILIAAMAPIITKRFNDKLRINAQGSAANAAFLVYDGTNGVWNPVGDALDSFRQISPGIIEFKNEQGATVHLKLSLQGAGGGGGGSRRTGELRVDSSASDTANQSVGSTVDKTWDFRIPRGISNVRVTLQGGGGSGGLGAAGTEEYLLPSARNGNEGDLCIKKYNIGDIPSLLPAGANMASFRDLSSYPVGQRGGIPTGTTLVASVASGATQNPVASNTCWYAKNQKTAGTCTSATGYSGCYRTVCTQDAAINACAALEPAGSWRLPNDAEIKRWRVTESSSSAYQAMGVVTSNASDFCDYTSSSYGAAQCYHLSAGCQGSADGSCIPHRFWSSVSKGYYYLSSGNLHGPYSNVTTYAFSARCVRSSSLCGFSPFAGAGGTSGAALADVSFKGLEYGDRLLFTAGKGGSDGAGGDTTVEHQRWNGLAWVKVSGSTTYTAKGGSAGGSASTTGHGVKNTVVPNCLADGNSYSSGCELGMAGKDLGSDGFNSGGSSIYGDGGPSSNSSSPNGINAEGFGAGGSGAYGSGSTAGQGGAGYARIKMNIASTGSGGGAGGYMEKNVYISVEEGGVIRFTIGKGGEGSTDDTGISGTDTKVEKLSASGGSVVSVLYKASGGLGGTFTPIVSNIVSEANLAKGAEGGRVYRDVSGVLTETVDDSTVTAISGKNAEFVRGGNGGLSKSDSRPSAYGGCVMVNNPASFSDCNSNASAMPALTPLYDKVKVLAQGGGGGGGGSCEDSVCYQGSRGGDGFVTVRW